MRYCSECGRKGKEGPFDPNDPNAIVVVHEDGRIKHPFTVKEENVAPRTRVVSPTGDEDYVPVLQEDDPEDASLLKQAQTIFEEDEEDGQTLIAGQVYDDETLTEVDEDGKLAADGGPLYHEGNPAPGSAMAQTNPNFGKPKKEDMVTVRGGGLYLTARRRIAWMRGEPIPRPDWTIDTYPEEIERGKFVNKTKVEGGYARYRANLFDESGRLIATGTKTEWSERFMDFAEKAETGAIARALAVAGFGTEAALDLDEGYEDDRIADAPVTDNRPINISASNVQGLVQGGRSTNVTGAQTNEIARLIKQLEMGMAIFPFIENVLSAEIPEFGEGDAAAAMDKFLKGLTFDQAATLIQALNRAASNASD